MTQEIQEFLIALHASAPGPGAHRKWGDEFRAVPHLLPRPRVIQDIAVSQLSLSGDGGDDSIGAGIFDLHHLNIKGRSAAVPDGQIAEGAVQSHQSLCPIIASGSHECSTLCASIGRETATSASALDMELSTCSRDRMIGDRTMPSVAALPDLAF